MDRIFASDFKKYFYSLTCISILFLFLLRFLFVPLIEEKSCTNLETAYSLIDSLISAIIVTMVVGGFIYWIKPKEERRKIKFIDTKSEIEKALVTAREDTNFWMFSGGTGRYTRSKTLPELWEIATKGHKHIYARIQILNPKNVNLIENYSRYRKHLKAEKNPNDWNLVDVQKKIYATIIASYQLSSKSSLMDVKISLKDTFSLLRIDMGQKAVVITKENPDDTSFFAHEDTIIYNSYREEFNQTFTQGTILNEGVTLSNPENLSLTNIQELLSDLGILETFVDDDFINSVIKIILENNNPFEIQSENQNPYK